MGNNKGRMIVYGKEDKNSAMYEAMFGGCFNEPEQRSKQKAEQQKQEIKSETSQVITTNPASFSQKSGEKKFESATPKNNPRTLQNSPNVNSGFKKWQQRQIDANLTPEQIDGKLRGKTMYSSVNILKDFGDFAGLTTFGYILDYSDIRRPDGTDIIVRIDQDKEGSASSLVMREHGDYLWEFIESQPRPALARQMVARLVALAPKDGFTISFDGKSIIVKGDKKRLFNMKWALVDLLEKIYDEDDEWNE